MYLMETHPHGTSFHRIMAYVLTRNPEMKSKKILNICLEVFYWRIQYLKLTAKKTKFVERKITEEKKETSYVTPITSNDFVVQEERSSVFPSKSDDPIEYFNLSFTDEVWNFIYKETQRYSTETFSMNELMSIIGVLLASRVTSQTRRRDYWSCSAIKRNLTSVRKTWVQTAYQRKTHSIWI